MLQEILGKVLSEGLGPRKEELEKLQSALGGVLGGANAQDDETKPEEAEQAEEGSSQLVSQIASQIQAFQSQGAGKGGSFQQKIFDALLKKLLAQFNLSELPDGLAENLQNPAVQEMIAKVMPTLKEKGSLNDVMGMVEKVLKAQTSDASKS